MSVRMRIIQRFKAPHEREFMALEREFAALEASRSDYPKGRRLQPMAANAPTEASSPITAEPAIEAVG